MLWLNIRVFTLSILWYIINLEQINVINFTLTLRRITQTIIRKRPKIIHVWNRETENVGSCYIIIEREKKAFQKTNYGSSFIEKDSKNLENQAPNTCWNAESIARSNWTINVLLQMGSLWERRWDFYCSNLVGATWTSVFLCPFPILRPVPASLLLPAIIWAFW